MSEISFLEESENLLEKIMLQNQYIQNLERQNKELSEQLESIRNSTIWRMTKPYRICMDSIKDIKKKSVLKKSQKLMLLSAMWFFRHGFFLPYRGFGCTQKAYLAQKNTIFPRNVKFSIIVPLYNTPRKFLKEMIGSVMFQTYSDWELCLADGSDEAHAFVEKICMAAAKEDGRIKYKKLAKNGGISRNTNACIEMATGDYISLFDHDDLLHPSALFYTMKAICEKDADFVYTDEATFKGRNLHNIIHTNFKPDFAPDYFLTNNYICHFSSFRKSLLDEVGGFDPATDGAQDFDMILRLSERTNKIVHVPKCLYYWRASASSSASGNDAKPYTTNAGKIALEKHFSRCGIKAFVSFGKNPNTYKISYPIKGNPLVSILIPSCDHAEILKKCIDSIKNESTYTNYEIIIIENNSKEKETFDYYDLIKNNEKIKIIEWKGTFNYSAINNFGLKYASGDYVLFFNNDTEVISPTWIDEMLMFAQRDDVGAVGAKLYYPSGKIQHGGVILGMGGVARHSHSLLPGDLSGYNSRCCTVQNYTAVTGACMMIPRRVIKKLNDGKIFDEELEVNFNDVDLCMKIRKMGLLVVWTPYAELYHYESESRGLSDTDDKKNLLFSEAKLFRKRWSKELSAGDPYYNPNLSLWDEDFSISGEIFTRGGGEVATAYNKIALIFP